MNFSLIILAFCILSVNCYNNYRHRGFHISNDDNNDNRGHSNVNQHYRNHNSYGSIVPSESNVEMLNKEDSSSEQPQSTDQQQQQPQEQKEDQDEDSNDSSEN